MKKNPHKIVKVQKTLNIMKTIVRVLCNLVVVKVSIDRCNGLKRFDNIQLRLIITFLGDIRG
jgi:hypothetical protein